MDSLFRLYKSKYTKQYKSGSVNASLPVHVHRSLSSQVKHRIRSQKGLLSFCPFDDRKKKVFFNVISRAQWRMRMQAIKSFRN